jgi:hypothetical protein
VPISAVLDACKTVELIVCLSGDPVADSGAHLSYKNRIAIIMYWDDVD